MSREIEVQSCIGALVSAYNTGSFLADILIGNINKKKRKKDSDIEAIVERKLLHRALSESSAQCKQCLSERHQQYGEAFALGDSLATNRLQVLLSTLQTRVIQPLQVACAEENALTDFARVHEVTIMSRNHAIHAMDELCQRIAMDGNTPRPHHARSISESAVLPGRTISPDPGLSLHSINRSSGVYASPSPPPQPANDSKLVMKVSHSPRSAPSISVGPRSAPATPTHSSVNANQARKRWEARSPPLRELSIKEDEEEDGASTRTSSISDQFSQLSFNTDSAHRRQTSLSISSVATSDANELPVSDIQIALPAYSDFPISTGSFDMKRPFSPDEDEARALQAPEVDVDKVLIHPAFRPSTSSERTNEEDHGWSPLPSPSRTNNFHGLCKGAWDISRNFHDGLSLRAIPQKDGTDLHQWICNACEFKSAPLKADQTKALLRHTYYHTKTTIRYRWLFLAKSHIHATKISKKQEGYPYGCIFCIAEGRPTAVHSNLDNLLSHIHTKHKSAMMTERTRSRTNCVVGEVVDRADWDINLPGSRKSAPTTSGGGARALIPTFSSYSQSQVPICQ